MCVSVCNRVGFALNSCVYSHCGLSCASLAQAACEQCDVQLLVLFLRLFERSEALYFTFHFFLLFMVLQGGKN